MTFSTSKDAGETLRILVVKNGNKLNVYSHDWQGKPVITVLTKDTPQEITYRDIRKAIMFFYPADLAMLMSKYPLNEILQGSPEKFLTEKDTNGNDTIVKILSRFETCSYLVLAEDTNIIKEYYFFDKATGKKRWPICKLSSVKIDKPLKDGIFDFDKYLQAYGIDKANVKKTKVPDTF